MCSKKEAIEKTANSFPMNMFRIDLIEVKILDEGFDEEVLMTPLGME